MLTRIQSAVKQHRQQHAGDKYRVTDSSNLASAKVQSAGVRRAPPPSLAKKKVADFPWRQLVHLIWRLVIFGAAVFYMKVSFRSDTAALEVLRGSIHTSMEFVPYESQLIPQFLGPTTVRESRIMQFLDDSTAPRNDSMYLESPDRVSFVNCSQVATFNSWLYGDAFLRDLWADLTANTAYGIPFFQESELIMPIVDCSFGSITGGDDTVARVFYLARSVASPDDVYVATLSLSMQDYLLNDEHQYGAAGIAALTFVNDISAKQVAYHYAVRLGYPYLNVSFEPYSMLHTSDEGFWVLESLPLNIASEVARVIQTASRTGFYVNSETEQSNIKNLCWEQPQDPILSMSKWQWVGPVVLRDSWAWVHGVHFFFAFETLSSLLLLLIVVYRNVIKRKFWMGDAFMSATSTIEIRGLLVLLSWYVNGFWRLMEFCLVEANDMDAVQRVYTNADIIRADLMTNFMILPNAWTGSCPTRGPAVVVFVFEIGFHYRQSIVSWMPATEQVAVNYAKYDYMEGMASIETKYTTVSPMRLWTMHPMVERDARFICATLFPTFVLFAIIFVVVVAKKCYRRVYPSAKVVWSKATGQSANETEPLLSWKSSLTVFETATGAPLQHRVGLATSYNNCIYIKGMKFASPDGIYCNGYVIAKEKYLLATSDMLALVVIVATRVRFKNVYAYEVQGHKVHQTARLVYPETLSLKDPTQLNISFLS